MLNWRENVISPIGFCYIPFFFCSFCFDFVIFFFLLQNTTDICYKMISWPLLVCFHFFRFDFLQMIYSNYVWQIWSIVYFDNNKRKYFVFHVSIGNFNSIEIYVIIIWLRESFEAQISHTVSQNRLKQKSVCDFFLNFSFKFNFTFKKRKNASIRTKQITMPEKVD